jgi:hypothetical protein
MSDKTNDEKLRILQERLAQIKQKKNISSATRENINKEIEVATTKTESPHKEKDPMSLKWLKYFILSFCIAFGASYVYNNIDFNSLLSDKIDKKEIDVVERTLEYNLDLKGDNIVITATLEDESSAKAMANDLKVKGFKADYFYLPNKSNSTKEVYKVFIGPYEHEQEANQWVENLELDFEIIPL